MMRTLSLLLLPLLLVGLLTAGSAAAFTQNEFTTAESLDEGMTQAGIFFTIGNMGTKDYRSLYPAFRYGLGAFFEVGLKFGATSLDNNDGTDENLGALIGVDMKYQLVKATEDIPLDLAVDLGLDTNFINGNNASEVTFSTIVSKGFPLMDRGYKLSLYGGVELSSMHGSYEYTTRDETNFFGMAGIEWKLSQKFMVIAEMKFGADEVGGLGIYFEY